MIEILQGYRMLLAEAAAELSCQRIDGCLHCRLVEASKQYIDPTADGVYLLLSYEWVGHAEDKPKNPYWHLRRYTTACGWEKRRWGFDTGGYENFEAVRWEPLPDCRSI